MIKISDVLNLKYEVHFRKESFWIPTWIDIAPNYVKRIAKVEKVAVDIAEYTFRNRLFYSSMIFFFFLKGITFEKSLYNFWNISATPFLNIAFTAPFLTALAGIGVKK